MHAFELHNVQVRIKHKDILSIPALSIPAGKITAVIGPSGSGKTTLLRLFNLLQTPSAGSLSFYGQSTTRLAYKKKVDIQREMAFVFQKPVMFNTSVYDNVATGLRYRGWAKPKVERQVKWALDLVRLQGYEKRQAVTLSGGEQQRIALARSIVTEPRALLLDEATANLDPGNVKIIEDVLLKLHRSMNTTLIMVTHNLQQAERLADFCLFLYQGEVLETADTKTFFHEPEHPLLHDFLTGQMVY